MMSEVLYQDNLIKIEVQIMDDSGIINFVKWTLTFNLFGVEEDEDRMIYNLPIEQLMSAFDVKTTINLLAVLKRNYNTSDAFDRFLSFVSDNHLKYDYWSDK